MIIYPTKKLGEVVEFQYGKGIDRSQRNEHGDVPIYGANGVLGWTTKAWTSGEAIIVGRKGSAGEITRISGKFWPSDVTYYVLGNDKIDIDYLFHFLKSANLPSFATGVKPGINRNQVYQIEIPIPPMAEQRKIVARIEKQFAKIDEAARLRAEAEALTEKLLPAALHEIFGSTTLTTGSSAESKGWKEKELGELIKLSSGSFLPSSQQIPGAHKIYGGNGVLGTHSKFNSNDRTVVIGRVGAYCGAVHITDPKSWVTDNALVVTEISEEIDLKFLTLILRKARLNQFAKKSAQPSLSQTTINKIKIPLPPLAEQKAIVKKLDALAEKSRPLVMLQARQASGLKMLKQSILHEVFA